MNTVVLESFLVGQPNWEFKRPRQAVFSAKQNLRPTLKIGFHSGGSTFHPRSPKNNSTRSKKYYRTAKCEKVAHPPSSTTVRAILSNIVRPLGRGEEGSLHKIEKDLFPALKRRGATPRNTIKRSKVRKTDGNQMSRREGGKKKLREFYEKIGERDASH